MAVWLYAVLHPSLNHGQAGVALLMLLFAPIAPTLYVLLHQCPGSTTGTPSTL